MGQTIISIDDLPDRALQAAAHFHAKHVPFALELLNGTAPAQDPSLLEDLDALALIFPSASKEHQGWRLAAIQALAREAAPKRVNGVAGDDLDAIHETIAWLAGAPGITGQLLAVDGKFTESG